MFVSGNIPPEAEYKAALRDVLQAFPYFQLAQVLFAKQMYDTHEPEATSRIKLASVYAPDRKAMYLLFKKIGDTPEPNSINVKKEKSEVKYNFVYSSTTAENSGIGQPTVNKENEQVSLSESFIQRELDTPPIIPPAKEELKPTAELKTKGRRKACGFPKNRPFYICNSRG